MRYALTIAGLAGALGALAWAAPPTAPEPRPALTDDDPLPEGAIARLGTTRYRGAESWSSAELSADCKSVLLTDFRGAALVDLATGKMTQRFLLKQDHSPPRPMRLCGNRVIGRENGRLLVWDATTGKLLHEYSGEPFEKGKKLNIGVLDASADGSVIAFGCSVQNSDPTPQAGREGSVWLLTFGETPAVREIRTGDDTRSGAGWLSPDGKTLVTTGVVIEPDKPDVVVSDFQIWDVATGKLRHRCDSTWGGVGVAAFSTDSKKFIVRDANGHGQVWDVATGKRVCKLDFHHNDDPDWKYWASWTLSPDGKSAACQYHNRAVQVWDATTGKKTAHHR